MSKNKIIGFIVLSCIALVSLIYSVRPALVHSALWHSKRTVKAVFIHEIKKMNIPLISQTRNLNCESATAAMILKYYGKESNLDVIQKMLPLNGNPHKGFRGDVDGPIWGFDNYGVYAEPIAKVMTELGIPSKAYTNITTDFLKKKILEGKPSIIWINIANPHPVTKFVDIDDEKVKLITGEHVAVVTGYENGIWILNDPWWTNAKDGTRVGQTLYVEDLNSLMWDDFDHMAV
ncbi:MAG: C39 family peptidase, partial [Patescibacteria group bacterium]